jgi:hypothetical protein
MAKLYKLQVELSPSQLALLNELQEAGDLRTKKDLLDNAFTLLKWAVKQKQEGNLIVSMNKQTGAVRELEYPYLQHAAEKQRLRQSGSGIHVSADNVADEVSLQL